MMVVMMAAMKVVTTVGMMVGSKVEMKVAK